MSFLKNILDSFKSTDRLLVEHFEKLTKEIYIDSNPLQVCTDLCIFASKNELYQKAGIISESESPSSKSKTMLAAIYCTQSIKKPEHLTKEDLDFLEVIARKAYVLSAVIVSADELSKLLTETIDEIQSAYSEKIVAHEKAWESFLNSEVDFHDLAKKFIT